METAAEKGILKLSVAKYNVTDWDCMGFSRWRAAPETDFAPYIKSLKRKYGRMDVSETEKQEGKPLKIVCMVAKYTPSGAHTMANVNASN